MASYRGHLMLSAPLGAAYGSLALLKPEWDWGPIFLGAGVTTAGGLVPDLDSDSGVPVRELFGVTAAAVSLCLYHPLREAELTREQVLVVLAGVYFFIRYGLANFFRRVTVHRGMFHSVPAMLIAGMLTYLIYPGRDHFLKVYLGAGLMLGFLSHLVLDEIYSVDFNGVIVRFNKYAGSAFKFTSPSRGATVATYLLLFVLGYAVWEGAPPWARPRFWRSTVKQVLGLAVARPGQPEAGRAP